jgi:hypothetical protein
MKNGPEIIDFRPVLGFLAALPNRRLRPLGHLTLRLLPRSDPENSEIEIGWTFLARSRWGGRYDGEMKQLMLRHAFGFVQRVVFLVGPRNFRSQRAVQKTGATLARSLFHAGLPGGGPGRYGAIRWQDHARFRLAVFCREEAGAIVEYLRWRAVEDRNDRERILVALDTFWTARAREAPTAVQLDTVVAEEARFVEALERDRGDPP